MENKKSLIYIAGHTGLIGSALVQKLKEQGYTNLLLPTHSDIDLRDQNAVKHFFEKNKPEFVFIIAGKVGGIHANINYPADFIYDNTLIAMNIIHNSYITNVKKLLFLGCSCMYPRNCSQPIKEESLLTGDVEKTNHAYAVAKITGLEATKAYREQYNCDFISAIANNTYGPVDKHDLEDAHVIPALIKKFLSAIQKGEKEVVLWGNGSPKREFLYSNDLADALIFLMRNFSQKEHINIGTGVEISIKELADLIKSMIGFNGEIIWDTTKPDGVPRKFLDVSKINSLGWRAKVSLKQGLEKTISEYVKRQIN